MNVSVEEQRDGERFVVFAVADMRLAVALEQVVRVTRAVEIQPLPGAPAVVAGVVVLRGERIAAIDMRRRLGLAPRELELSDRLVLVRRGAWRWFLIADAVIGVVELPCSSMRERSPQAPPPAQRGADDCRGAEFHLEEGVVSQLELAHLLTSVESHEVRRLLAEWAAE